MNVTGLGQSYLCEGLGQSYECDRAGKILSV